MQNHCCFRWKQFSPPEKADFLRDFSSIPAASDAPFSLFKGANASVFSRLYFLASAFTTQAEISSLSSKGFHSRNTLEIQPSFRNSLLNTVYHCKPQSAILFYLPLIPFWYNQSPVAWFPAVCNLRPFWYIYIYN